MKAIETHWKGYRFRSRLEARWAVFFDAAGFDWEYEPEGFSFEGISYLPDFLVSTPQGGKIWYEVKPKGVHQDDKFDAFLAELHATGSAERAALLSGDPVAHFQTRQTRTNYFMGVCPRCGLIDFPAYGTAEDKTIFTFGCQPCDFETPSGGRNETEDGILGMRVQPHKGILVTFKEDWLQRRNKIENAAFKARSARFEHGESPAVGAR